MLDSVLCLVPCLRPFRGGEGFPKPGTQRIMAACATAHTCFTYASRQIDETACCSPSNKSISSPELIAAAGTTSAKTVSKCKAHGKHHSFASKRHSYHAPCSLTTLSLTKLTAKCSTTNVTRRIKRTVSLLLGSISICILSLPGIKNSDQCIILISMSA